MVYSYKSIFLFYDDLSTIIYTFDSFFLFYSVQLFRNNYSKWQILYKKIKLDLLCFSDVHILRDKLSW